MCSCKITLSSAEVLCLESAFHLYMYQGTPQPPPNPELWWGGGQTEELQCPMVPSPTSKAVFHQRIHHVEKDVKDVATHCQEPSTQTFGCYCPMRDPWTRTVLPPGGIMHLLSSFKKLEENAEFSCGECAFSLHRHREAVACDRCLQCLVWFHMKCASEDTSAKNWFCSKCSVCTLTS